MFKQAALVPGVAAEDPQFAADLQSGAPPACLVKIPRSRSLRLALVNLKSGRSDPIWGGVKVQERATVLPSSHWFTGFCLYVTMQFGGQVLASDMFHPSVPESVHSSISA